MTPATWETLPEALPTERKVAAFFRHHPLSGPWVVGVSGGPDSLALLHILRRLREKLGLELYVAHLNHMTRGKEGEADALFVAQVCQEWGLPATIEARDTKAYSKARRLSLEAAGREARYAFFAEVVKARGSRGVAVAHQQDDQVETVLLHLLRGSGLYGLRGMEPVAQRGGLAIIRPFLEVSRREIEAYLEARHLTPRRDASNLSPSFLRNRLRLHLLPLLRSYNPGINSALLRLARAASEALMPLETQARSMLEAYGVKEGEGSLFPRKGLNALPPPLLKTLLHILWEEAGGPAQLTSRHLEAMAAAVNRPGHSLALPGGYSLFLDQRNLWLGRPPQPTPFPPLPREYFLKIPGETAIPGWKVIAELSPPKGEGDRFQATFNLEKTGENLKVRSRRPGDRFQPSGFPLTKKLQDFFVDEKIPLPWRDGIPLVVAGDEIIWVVGYRRSEKARATSGTRQLLTLSFLGPSPQKARP